MAALPSAAPDDTGGVLLVAISGVGLIVISSAGAGALGVAALGAAALGGEGAAAGGGAAAAGGGAAAGVAAAGASASGTGADAGAGLNTYTPTGAPTLCFGCCFEAVELQHAPMGVRSSRITNHIRTTRPRVFTVPVHAVNFGCEFVNSKVPPGTLPTRGFSRQPGTLRYTLV